MRRYLTGLWNNPDFVKLWLGQTVSQFGSGITGIALPLTAVLVLAATPAQMGILGALDGIAVLVIGLLAGVRVDRIRRRPCIRWRRSCQLFGQCGDRRRQRRAWHLLRPESRCDDVRVPLARRDCGLDARLRNVADDDGARSASR